MPRETPAQAEPPREQRTLELPLSAPSSSPSASVANPHVAPPAIQSTPPQAPARRESDADAHDGDDASGRKSDNAA
jgi:hypothetical protein